MKKNETFDETVKRVNAECPRRRMGDEEHQIQVACVQWFSFQYPNLRGRLFAVPNGGRRDKATAGKLKAEGAYAGVSDLILLKPNKEYGALLIEMKTETGRQSDGQKKWESLVTSENEYKYVICRSLDDFMEEVNNYLKNC